MKIDREQATGHYVIHFRPNWVGKSNANLILKISPTNDILEYQLIGYGEPPLGV